MSKPTAGDVHVNKPLTNVSVAFMQNATNFVASQVFPLVPSGKQGDLYFKYARDDWARIEAKPRGPATESAGGGYALTTDSYYCQVDAIHKDVADQERANQDDPVDLDQEAAMYVSEQMLLKREKNFMSAFFKTSLWTGSSTAGDITPGTLWDNSASDPVSDVDLQSEHQAKITGRKPNIMIVTPDVFAVLKNNARVRDQYKHTGNQVITEQMLASLFGVSKFLVARASENTAVEGAAAVYSYMGGTKKALLCYAAPNPGRYMPSAGYIFGWTGLVGSGPQAQRIKRFRMENLSADRVEGEIAQAMKVVATDMGCFFTGVIA